MMHPIRPLLLPASLTIYGITSARADGDSDGLISWSFAARHCVAIVAIERPTPIAAVTPARVGIIAAVTSRHEQVLFRIYSVHHASAVNGVGE